MAQYILKKTSIIYLCYFVILVAFDQSLYISTLLTAHKLDNSKKKKNQNIAVVPWAYQFYNITP